MKKVKDFNDFLVGLMLEAEKPKFHGVTELPFVISARLKELLSKISHPIAKKLIETDKQREDKKVTFVDLSDEADNKFSLINSNKAYDNLIGAYKNADLEITEMDAKKKLDDMNNFDHTSSSPILTKNRAQVKIGAFVNKVYPKEFKQGGDPGNDIESFVQSVIAKRKSSENFDDRFNLVNGEDIIRYYRQDKYDVRNPDDDTPVHGSPLASSCMRYDYCGDYVNFYAQNKDVSLLILMSDVEGREDKIVGRALVWKLAQPSGRTFMDRIYYRYETDMAMFKQYAEKQGWLYKGSQNMSASASIVDTKDNTTTIRYMKTLPTFEPTDQYPYMDTMKWFNVELKYLTNDEDERNSGYDVYFLEDTGGGYENAGEQGVYVDYYGEYFDEDDLIWCEYGDEYRTQDDAIYIEQYGTYATDTYVENHMRWSDFEQEYIDEDYAVYSEYHNDYINNDDAITMSTGADGDFDEVREDDDDIRHVSDIGNSAIEYKGKDGEWYYFDKNEYGQFFIKVAQIIKDNRIGGWKHKVWDKNKLYKHNGQWHYEFDPKVKDEIVGQKRLWED